MGDDEDLETVPDDETAEPDDVAEQPDGGAIIRLKSDETEPKESAWFANLAETLPDKALNTLATGLLELIEIDKQARKKRDEQYSEGLRRTGLGDDAPGGAQFQGASKAVHPVLTEGCVDFSARAMKELLPRGGPVKDYTPGKVTADKIAKAQRKTTLMNWQLTVQCKEFRAELEQLITQVPMGGVQYMKVTWDEGRNRPQFLFVGVDEMYLPFAATNFYTAQRRTHVQYLTRVEYERRIKSGMYRDIDAGLSGLEPDYSDTSKTNDTIEGREDTGYNEDGLRTVFEVFTIADLEDKYGAAPYIVTIDKISMKVLALYRNWSEDDDSMEELQHFAEFPFIPWRGAYPIGLPHMIGTLSGAATGALRALLDSAHIQNAPTALKLKGGKIGGQTKAPQPGEVLEIEGGFGMDDIRKVAMPIPFNPPSPTLFSLLSYVVDAAKGVVRTSLDDLPDMQTDVPVGTTLARIEQGMVVYSAIHGRLHDGMFRLLGILHRLNGLYLDDDDIEQEVGEKLATRADFEGPMDVVPVSDPNIFSEVQRISQVQIVAQRADLKPQLYDQRKVEEMLLTSLKVPNGDQLLVPAATPKEQNAVNENVAASLGKPVVAFPEQDHLAHLATHISYLKSPTFGALPTIAQSFVPVMLGHLREHVALWYANDVFKQTSDVLGTDLGDFMRQMNDDSTPPERQEMDRMLAEVSQSAVEKGQNILGMPPPPAPAPVQPPMANGQPTPGQAPPGQALAIQPPAAPQGPQSLGLPQIIAEAQKMMQSFQQPGAADPRLALENKKIDARTATDTQQLQLEAQHHDQQLAADQAKISAKAQEEAANRAAMLQANQADNLAAEQIAELRALTGNGRAPSQNPNPRP